MLITDASVKRIALVVLFVAMILTGFGLLMAILGEMISDFGTMADQLAGKMVKLNGVLLMVSGMASLIISIGLYRMQDWARHWGSQFFRAFFFLSLLFFIFNVLTSFICSMMALFFSLLSAYCWMKLRSPHMKGIFEGAQYEPPDWAGHGVTKSSVYVEKKTMEPDSPEQDIVNVPDNMMLCPNCQTMNLKTNTHCRTCGSEF